MIQGRECTYCSGNGKITRRDSAGVPMEWKECGGCDGTGLKPWARKEREDEKGHDVTD